MMSVARHPSLCLICQTRQFRLSRRRICTTPRQRVPKPTSIAVRPEDDGFLLAPPPPLQNINSKRVLRQFKNDGERESIPTDALRDLAAREAALSFEALYRERDARIQTLRSLSNPWPGVRADMGRHPPNARLPEPQDMHISHATFRQNIKAAIGCGSKAARQVMRAQLLRAEWPKDILRVVAVAMQHRETAVGITHLHEPIMRALYRCRDHVSDPKVLETLHAIITRFRYAGLKVKSHLLYLALKFAARSRSKESMRKYLKMIREDGIGMSSNVYRSVVAKCSIGNRGLGEIRNGRWKQSDLREVLLGFEGCEDLAEEEKYHFGTFLNRDDWQYLHGWVAILARVKESEAVWKEWLLWRETKAYKEPRLLVVPGEEDVNRSRVDPDMTTKLRGVYWFVESMVCAGDIAKAWVILKESGVPFSVLKQRIKFRMLDEPEHVVSWDETMRQELLKKYDSDLAKIEQALGVVWKAGVDEGDGQHELYMDQEEALDRLGSAVWKWNEQIGYPWEEEDQEAEEESSIMFQSERELHDAAEERTWCRVE